MFSLDYELRSVRHLDRSGIMGQESSTTTTPGPTVQMGNPALTFVHPLFHGNNVALRQNHRRIETRIFPFESLVRQNTPVAFRTYARSDDCTLLQHPSSEITQNACSIHRPSFLSTSSTSSPIQTVPPSQLHFFPERVHSVVPETGPFRPLDVSSSLEMVSDPLECSSMISDPYSKDLLSKPSSGMERLLHPGESDPVEYEQLYLETQDPLDDVTNGPSNSGIDDSIVPSPSLLSDATTQLSSKELSIDSRATSVTTSESGPRSTPDSLYWNENSTSDDLDYDDTEYLKSNEENFQVLPLFSNEDHSNDVLGSYSLEEEAPLKRRHVQQTPSPSPKGSHPTKNSPAVPGRYAHRRGCKTHDGLTRTASGSTRFVWSETLKELFDCLCDVLDEEDIRPKTLLQLLSEFSVDDELESIEHLSAAHVKSHLQKWRVRQNRLIEFDPQRANMTRLERRSFSEKCLLDRLIARRQQGFPFKVEFSGKDPFFRMAQLIDDSNDSSDRKRNISETPLLLQSDPLESTSNCFPSRPENMMSDPVISSPYLCDETHSSELSQQIHHAIDGNQNDSLSNSPKPIQIDVKRDDSQQTYCETHDILFPRASENFRDSEGQNEESRNHVRRVPLCKTDDLIEQQNSVPRVEDLDVSYFIFIRDSIGNRIQIALKDFTFCSFFEAGFRLGVDVSQKKVTLGSKCAMSLLSNKVPPLGARASRFVEAERLGSPSLLSSASESCHLISIEEREPWESESQTEEFCRSSDTSLLNTESETQESNTLNYSSLECRGMDMSRPDFSEISDYGRSRIWNSDSFFSNGELW